MLSCFSHVQLLNIGRVVLLYIFFSVACGLIEDSWISVSASIFNGLHYSIWVEVYEENLASHRYIVGKGTNILMVFLYDFR